MSGNSLITSEFSGVPLTGIAFTNISLDTPVLKYQPLNNSSTDFLAPLPLDASSKPTSIIWLDETIFAVLYENKPYFDLVNSTNVTKISQHVDLVIATNPASCSCATFDKINNIFYVLDTSNRLYTYVFDKFASSGSVLEEISNYVITDLNEAISKVSVTKSANKLLLMSNSLYEFNLETKSIERSINLFVDRANCYQIIDDYLLISSNNDRFINLIDLARFQVIAIFVMNSPVIKFQIVKHKNKSVLAAIDQDGFVELFKDPFITIQQRESVSSTPNSKRRRRTATNLVKSIQYSSILKLYNEETMTTTSKIDNIIFDHDQLVISYLQNENYFIVDKFNWFTNPLSAAEITLQRKKNSFDHLKLRSQDKASLTNYAEDPSKVTIRTGDNFIDLDPIVKQDAEADELNNEDEDEDEDDGDDFSTLVSRLDKSTNSRASSSFKNTLGAIGDPSRLSFQVGTLTTNLSQALRNNDNSMFDSIINNTTEERVVKSTISQLEQHSVLKMLDKLAELVFKNKFKNTVEAADVGLGNSSIGLTTWIRYVLVYHGTYLIGAAGGNGDLRRRLGLLGLSMGKRAGNMNRLLELKGCLSMVSAKVAVTRELESLDGQENDLDEEDVEYIEEEEDEAFDDSYDQNTTKNNANGGYQEEEEEEDVDDDDNMSVDLL